MLKTKTIIPAALLTFLLFGFLQPSQAGMVTTHDLVATHSMPDLVAQRGDIQRQLVELGVEPQLATQRAASLSDTQLTQISQRLAEMPAGADIGGILLTVFIVFVITDVIGATDIFPFIKPVL